MIREYLHARGYNRTTEQCRDKVKKIRLQYQKVQDAVSKSGSSTMKKTGINGMMQLAAS